VPSEADGGDAKRPNGAAARDAKADTQLLYGNHVLHGPVREIGLAADPEYAP